MTQTIDTSRRLTVEEARERTARLIAECPEWCTREHDPKQHPDDVQHIRNVGSTVVGDVLVYAWAIPFDSEPPTGMYVEAARFDGDPLSYDEAMKVANVMARAATMLKDITDKEAA